LALRFSKFPHGINVELIKFVVLVKRELGISVVPSMREALDPREVVRCEILVCLGVALKPPLDFLLILI